MSTPAPGWYPDPSPPPGAPGGLRWWDGHAWSPYAGPAGGPSAPDGEPLAEWWRRLLAWLVDVLILGVPFVGLAAVVVVLALGAAMSDGTTTNGLSELRVGLAFGVLVVAAVLYEALFLRFKGATPGKLLLGIRVRLLARPGRLPWGTIVVRVLAQFGTLAVVAAVPVVGGRLVWLVVLVDGLWPLWDGRRQALHDKAARTVVVVAR